VNEPETIRTILESAKTIAVVGLSGNPDRPSFHVSRYMQRHGYRIVPVNPIVASALGEKAYPSLDAAAGAVGRIDVVDVFRASRFVAEIVEQTIRLGIHFLWLQQGVRDEEAARRAEASGIKVVMDRCIYQEHAAMGPLSPAGASCPI
jgi:uncharacterized protein